jgi:hypothetical protein
MSSQAYKRILSGSSDGDGILITDITTSGTTIHIATSSSTEGTYDEVWLWAYNSNSSDEILTIEYGSTSFKVTVPFQCGLVPILPGLPIQNSLEISAYSTNSSVITIYGFAHYISDSSI